MQWNVWNSILKMPMQTWKISLYVAENIESYKKWNKLIIWKVAFFQNICLLLVFKQKNCAVKTITKTKKFVKTWKSVIFVILTKNSSNWRICLRLWLAIWRKKNCQKKFWREKSQGIILKSLWNVDICNSEEKLVKSECLTICRKNRQNGVLVTCNLTGNFGEKVCE